MGRSLHFVVMMLLALMSQRATAQDIPGLEACTAEKQMERRTGCLQSNDDFLQRTLSKLSRETQAKIAASDRDLRRRGRWSSKWARVTVSPLAATGATRNDVPPPVRADDVKASRRPSGDHAGSRRGARRS